MSDHAAVDVGPIEALGRKLLEALYIGACERITALEAALAARDEENHALREAVRVYVSEVARAAEWLALMPDPEQGYDPTVVSALEYMGRLDPGHDEDSEVAQAILTLRAALAVSRPAQTDSEGQA